MSNKQGYNRYQLTYPFEGNKIYETRSLERAAEKSYRDLLNEINNYKDCNVFTITDIDNRIEYNFQIDNKDLCFENNKDVKIPTKILIDSSKESSIDSSYDSINESSIDSSYNSSYNSAYESSIDSSIDLSIDLSIEKELDQIPIIDKKL